MSSKFPIIALTGASGAGKTNIKEIFRQLFIEMAIKAYFIEGDSFHKYSRKEMDDKKRDSSDITHFSPEANLLEELENLFQDYSRTGTGKARHYIHTHEDSVKYQTKVGHFTNWKEFETPVNLLFYEGLHGGYADGKVNIARHVDLLIGVAPLINLEWMQKIKRDELVRGHSKDNTMEMIMHRLPHYAKYICSQFSRTDANLQRIPLIDTSNPFSDKNVPDDTKSLFLLEIKKPEKFPIELCSVKDQIPGSFLSTPNTIISPATSLDKLLTNVFSPTINRLASQI